MFNLHTSIVSSSFTLSNCILSVDISIFFLEYSTAGTRKRLEQKKVKVEVFLCTDAESYVPLRQLSFT
jgi:hypothetical protein